MRRLLGRLKAWRDSPAGQATSRMALLAVGIACLKATLESTEKRLTKVEGELGAVTGWVPHDDVATLADLDKVAAGEWTVPTEGRPEPEPPGLRPPEPPGEG